MNSPLIPRSAGCTCQHRQESETPAVPLAAFNALRRQVQELSAIVQELAKLQPGSDAPPPQRAARSIQMRQETSAPALVARATRIVGGKVTNRFPHCALIGHKPRHVDARTQWFCSGVLIHPRVVLSAAHCQSPQAPPNMVALNGRNIEDLSEAEIIPILKTFVHEGYGAHRLIPNHDLVAHILAQPAKTGAVLVAEESELAQARKVTLAGFGNDDIYSTRGFGIKREVTVDLVAVRRSANENLDELEARYRFESDDEFVAGNPVMDSCQGDSGGPAYIESSTGEWLVAGVTSRGVWEPNDPNGDTPCGDGGIYTRLDKQHWEWIKRATKSYLKSGS